MRYNVIPTDNFKKEIKKIAKKYLSVKENLDNLVESLKEDPTQGAPLGNHVYKIRLAITSKNKGKSSGARVITYVFVQDKEVYLMSIYDKSEKESISDIEIKNFLKYLPPFK